MQNVLQTDPKRPLYGVRARRTDDPRAHREPPSEAAAVAELHDAARARPKLARHVPEPRAHPAAAQHNADATPLERLRHVAAVGHDELQDAYAPGAANVHPAQCEATHDPTGRPDDDHDADAHPQRDRGVAPPTRGEEHECVVVSRLRVPGDA
jgi:hypothetical protein